MKALNKIVAVNNAAVELDIKLSRKALKVAVNKVSLRLSDEYSEVTYLIVREDIKLANQNIVKFTKALGGISLKEMAQLSAPAERTKSDVLAASSEENRVIREQWANYTLAQKTLLLQHKVDVLNDFVDDKFVKKFRTIIKAIINAHLNVSRKDEFVLNSILKSVNGAIGREKLTTDFQASATLLETLSKTGLFSLRTESNRNTDTIEWMVKINHNLNELRNLKHTSSDRFIRFGSIDSVKGRDIVGKKGFAYGSECNAEAAEGIDSLNEVQLTFVGEESDIEILTKRQLFDKEQYKSAVLSEEWQQRIYRQNMLEYKLLVANGNKFSIEKQADGVWRLYDKSNFFGVQTNSLMREKIALYNEEPLNDCGIATMKLYVAGKAGYDKVLEEEAMEAYEAYNAEWRASGKYDREFEIIDGGVGYSTGYLTEWDAQTQGFGIYGLLSADIKTLKLSGFEGDDYRTDAYSLLAAGMNSKLSVNTWLRSQVKPAFMTTLYGAKYKTIMFGSSYDEENEMFNIKGKACPLMSVSANDSRDTWIAFKSTMQTIAPRAMDIMEVIEKLAKVSPHEVVRWTLPDGIIAEVAMQENQSAHINWVAADGSSHTVKHEWKTLVAGSRPTSWSPRIVQSIDAYLLRTVAKRLAKKGIELVTIHDAYMVHPNYASILRRVYREVANEILQGNLLSKIITEITGIACNFQAGKNVEKCSNAILNSKYALWM